MNLSDSGTAIFVSVDEEGHNILSYLNEYGELVYIPTNENWLTNVAMDPHGALSTNNTMMFLVF